MKNFANIYVHLPFCDKICPFCAFAVETDQPQVHTEYIEYVLHEAQLRKASLKNRWSPLKSLYFGGGTPSRLSLPLLTRLIQGLKSQFTFDNNIQITFEVNPEDAHYDYLKGLQDLGINRLSLGVQSLQDLNLKHLGRVHRRAEVLQALENLKRLSWENFSVDLMFGYPEQSSESFAQDLRELLQWQPKHLSLYALEVDHDTPFGRSPNIRQWVVDHEDQTVSIYNEAVRQLEAANLHQYEVSNFAQSGFHSRSNLLVWSGEPYLGLGCAAHSYYCSDYFSPEIKAKTHSNNKVEPLEDNSAIRWANLSQRKDYIQCLSKGELPTDWLESLSQTQQANEQLMLALRQTEGLDFLRWCEQFQVMPATFSEKLTTLQKKGLVKYNDFRLVLTLEGFLLADSITTELML